MVEVVGKDGFSDPRVLGEVGSGMWDETRYETQVPTVPHLLLITASDASLICG